MSNDDLILDIKIANYRARKHQEELKHEQFISSLPIIKAHKLQIMQQDYAKLKMGMVLGIPLGIVNIILFKSLMVFPMTLTLTVGFNEQITNLITKYRIMEDSYSTST